MANPFEASHERRQQNLKETSSTAETKKDDPLGLSARKRTRQTYTVYLDKELMGRVQRMAKQRDVSASAVIEACVKLALDQMEV